jgi:putative peptidoglycan lipid II flippase
MEHEEQRRRLLRSTASVALPTLVSRLLGYVRDLLQAYFLGTGHSADAFTIAFTIPNLFRRLTGEGAMTAAFVPTFTELKKKGDRRQLWAFGNIFFYDLALVMAAVTVLGILFAPGLVTLIAHGFKGTEGKWAQTISMTRIMFPYLFFISLAALASAILNSFRRFFVPASTPVLFNLAVIASAALLARGSKEPALVFCLGVLAGGVLQLGFQVPFLWKEGMRFTFGLSFKHSAVRRVAALMVPGILGASVYQVNFALSRMIASSLERGSTAALYYSSRIEELTLGLFSIALSVALLPAFSEHAAARDIPEMKRTLGFSLKLTSFVTFPAAAGLVVLSRPIIRVLFERGMFDRESTALSSACLLFFALGLPFVSGVKMIAPAFFSLKDTRSPVIVGIFVMAVNVGLSFALMGRLRVGGLALALSLSQVANFIVLLIWLERKIGAVDKRDLAAPAGRALAATVLMAGVLRLLRPVIDVGTAPFVRQAAALAGAIGLGMAVYFLFLWIFSPKDARELAATVFHAARPGAREEVR